MLTDQAQHVGGGRLGRERAGAGRDSLIGERVTALVQRPGLVTQAPVIRDEPGEHQVVRALTRGQRRADGKQRFELGVVLREHEQRPAFRSLGRRRARRLQAGVLPKHRALELP